MTENEMERMQQEAIRRTQEMHRRANSFRRPQNVSDRQSPPHNEVHIRSESTPPDSHNDDNTDKAPENTDKPENLEYHKPPENIEGVNKSGGIFDTLFKDKEKTLILGILLLLMDEKTDNGLLMALMYLLI